MAKGFQIKFPDDDINRFRELLTFDKEKLKNFSKIITKLKDFDDDEEFKSSFKVISEDYDFIKEIIQILKAFNRMYIGLDMNLDEFIENINNSFKVKNLNIEKEFSTEKFIEFKDFLYSIFKTDNELSINTKADTIKNSNCSNFADAKIITDIRPIFGIKNIMEIKLNTIIHNLTIEYVENHKPRVKYFALDNEDLILLKDVIDRALKKEETIKNIFKSIEFKG